MLDNRQLPLVALLLVVTLGCVNASAVNYKPRPIDTQLSEPMVVGLTTQEADAGRQFLPLMRQFGLPRFVFAARALGGGSLFEYLSPGDHLESWTKLGVVHVLRSGVTNDDASNGLPQYVESLRSHATAVRNAEFVAAPYGGLYLTHYETPREEVLSAAWVAAPGHIVDFQISSRGTAVPEAQVEGFIDFFRRLTTRSAS